MVNKMLVMGAAQAVVQKDTSRESGNAIAYKQEQDDSTLSPVIKSMEGAWNRTLKGCLQLASQFLTVPQLIKMTSGSKVQVENGFKGEMLENNFDVLVSLTQGFPNSPTAKRQMILQYVDKGIITPQKAAGFLELGDVDGQMHLDQISTEAAEQTITDLEAGKPVNVHPWDDHATMVQYLLAAMRERYEEWPPMVKRNFEQNLTLHQKFMAVFAHPASASAGPLSEQMGADQPGGPPAGGSGLASGAEPPQAGPSAQEASAGSQPDRASVIPAAVGVPT